MATLVIFCVFLAAAYVWRAFKKPRNPFPPGPFSWPLIGNLPSLLKTPHVSLAQIGETYKNKMFSVRLGAFNAIVLQNAEDIREAFKKIQLCGRPDFSHITSDRNGTNFRGIAFNCSQKYWTEIRNETAKCLMETRKQTYLAISARSLSLAEAINENCWKPFDVRPLLRNEAFRVMISTLTGEVFSGAVLNQHLALASAEKQPRWMRFFPFIGKARQVLYLFNAWNTKPKCLSKWNLIQELIATAFVKRDNPRGFLDLYVQRSKSETDEESPFFLPEGVFNLEIVVKDLLYASVSTISEISYWAVVLLAGHPGVQSRMADEMLTVLGGRTPEIADLNRLHYTMAVVYECMRFSCAVPLGVFHSAWDRAKLKNYDVPENTLLLPNFFAVSRAKSWTDPDNFNPENFLTRTGKFDDHRLTFLPFSVGPRRCPGGIIGKATIVAFLAATFTRFRVSAPAGSTLTLRYSFGSVLALEANNLVFTEREDNL